MDDQQIEREVRRAELESLYRRVAYVQRAVMFLIASMYVAPWSGYLTQRMLGQEPSAAPQIGRAHV